MPQWLSDEHFVGGVINTAATMNKRSEIRGKGQQFNVLSREEIVRRYNTWAAQLVERIDAVQSGRATPAQYLDSLARFRADPIHNTP